VARALVDALHGLGVRSLREAEHLPRLRVRPRVLEVHALVVLDVEIRLVRLRQRLLRDAHHALVDVHIFRHGLPPNPKLMLVDIVPHQPAPGNPPRGAWTPEAAKLNGLWADRWPFALTRRRAIDHAGCTSCLCS